MVRKTKKPVSFVEIAEKITKTQDHKILNHLHACHKKLIKSFKDPRIAGLQYIVDYIFSDCGKYKNPVSVDITEFFRLNEKFGVGFSITEQNLGSALLHRVNVINSKELVKFIIDYKQVLLGKIPEDFVLTLDNLMQRNISKASLLLNGTYMNCESDSNEFQESKVIVTGSDTGIGRAIALEFARRGAKVALHYPTPELVRGAISAEELILESSGQAKSFQGDFRKIKGIYSFVDQAIDYLKGVDIIINNAGITLNKAFPQTTPKDFDTLVNVNLKGAYFLIQKIFPYMNKKARIINLSSNHAIRGMAGHSVYAATKAGISALTRVLAMELSPIRINSVNPGWVAGVNNFNLLPEINYNEFGKNNIPLGSISRPDEFAKHILWLASKNSKYMTGQNLVIDSGVSVGMHFSRDCTQISDKPWGAKYLNMK